MACDERGVVMRELGGSQFTEACLIVALCLDEFAAAEEHLPSGLPVLFVLFVRERILVGVVSVEVAIVMADAEACAGGRAAPAAASAAAAVGVWGRGVPPGRLCAAQVSAASAASCTCVL